MQTLEYKIALHQTQREVFYNQKRFRVTVCGRRWGKSNMMLQSILFETLNFQGVVSILSPETVLVVMPTQLQCRAILFKPMVKLLEETNLRHLLAPKGINRSSMTIQFMGKPIIKFTGANDRNGDGCRGTRIYFLAADETQDILPVVWSEVLRPAMSDTVGSRALFTGTPKGTMNILYDLAHTPDDEWAFFTYPTSANPCIPRAEIAKAKEILPPRVFAQEYEAAFVSFAGQIYTELSIQNICTIPKVELPNFDLIVLGVDWGSIHPSLVVLGRAERTATWYYLEGWSPNIQGSAHEPILIGRVHDNIKRLCASWNVDSIYCDPSLPSEILAIRALGNQKRYQTAREGFNKIASGINQVHSLIHQRNLLFTIGLAADTPDAIDGQLAYNLLQSYHYESRKGIVIEVPADGGMSHQADALRYALAYKGG